MLRDTTTRISDALIERASATGYTVLWRRDLDRANQVVVRDPDGRLWLTSADDWADRLPFAGDATTLRQHGRLTSAQILDWLGLVPAEPTGGHGVVIHAYTGSRITSGTMLHGSFTHDSTPVTVRLDRLSPTARRIAECIISTDWLHPGSHFVVESESGERGVYLIEAYAGKYYPHKPDTIYAILERAAAQVDERGLRVIGPAWRREHGAIVAASPHEPERRTLTTAAAAAQLGVSPKTIWKHATALDIPRPGTGRQLLLSPADVAAIRERVGKVGRPPKPTGRGD